MVRYARLHARRIGPSAAERPAYDGAFHLLVPDQTLRCGISGSELPGYAQRALRAHHAPADSSRSRGGPAAFLLRGSAAAPAAAMGGTALCRSYKHRLPLAVSGGSMARTSGQGAAARGPVQRRKRKFHAGNTPDRERIFGQPPFALLLRQDMARRLDQCGEPLSCDNSTRHARFRQVLHRGEQLHPPADREGLRHVPLRLQIRRLVLDRLQPPFESPGRLRNPTEILHHQFRRSPSFEPLQSHRSGVYDRHLGRLRIGLYDHAQPQ